MALEAPDAESRMANNPFLKFWPGCSQARQRSRFTVRCFRRFLAGFLFLFATSLSTAQTLNLPPRATNALTGSQFANLILEMTQTSRENWVLDQIMSGNIPGWMRPLAPITVNKTIAGTPHTLTYYVIPDYLSIGSDTDYFQQPMSPILAQRLANLLNCSLPTRLMVNQIWTNSAVKMTANTFNPTNYAINTPPVFLLENTANRVARFAVTNSHPLGALVSGDKKDLIVSTLIYTNFANSGVTNVVVIYGWIQPGGSPIQPEYNGHEETYMDYSHGTRLVQMNVLLDGATQTVTNILSDANLNPLLSDEGVIAKPFYTVDNFFVPYVITQPMSRNLKLGDTAVFKVNAVGYAPLAYQWKLNGATLIGTTNSLLVITNAQVSDAGTYTVTIGNSYGTATTLPSILRVSATAFPLLFSDSLSADTSANWLFYFGSAGAPDYAATWACDFSAIPYTWNGATYLVPPAPSTPDGSARGLKLTVNNSNAVICGVSVYPKGMVFSNNFALKFDFWINYPGGANGSGATGSTEFLTCGINHLGTEPNWAATNASSTDGIFFATDGEGGSSRDYRAYLGSPTGNPTDLTGTASGLVANIHTAAPFPTLFPANRFETAGAPGKNWIAAEVIQSNGVITWTLDGVIVAQRTNTSAFVNGNIMLGYMDIFASVASPLADAFVLFANVRVEDRSSLPLLAPVITTQPQSQTVFSGTNVTFSLAHTGAQPCSYQWTFNGTNISGATTNILSLNAVQTTNAGSYGVVIRNVAGAAFSSAAVLTVNVRPFYMGPVKRLTNGNVELSINGALGTRYTLQTSSNLTTWSNLTNFVDLANPVTILDTNAAPAVNRFYRLVTTQ